MSLKHPTLVVRKGDLADSIQELLGLSFSPKKLDEDDGPGYFYHLENLGFWVFFDEHHKVYSIRFNYPYPYEVNGVKIGDTTNDVLRKKGKPHRNFPFAARSSRWIYDFPVFLRIDFNPDNNRVEKIFR